MPEKLCDPNVCDCCQYIGEGDFFCDKYMEIVVEDWIPNENFLMCARERRREKKPRRKKTRNGGAT